MMNHVIVRSRERERERSAAVEKEGRKKG
jgi:hypothetical protein